MGYGPEFLARIHQIFLFNALGEKIFCCVRLESFVGLPKPFIQDQGYTLVAGQDFANDVASVYEPRDGVQVSSIKLEQSSRDLSVKMNVWAT